MQGKPTFVIIKLLLLVLAFSLLGCAGGGGTSGTGGNGQNPQVSIVLTATPTTITAGQSTQLSWTSANATRISQSSFGANENELQGTRTVSPAATTTYSITAEGPGGPVSSQVTVTVTQPSGAAFRLVANSTNAEAREIREQLLPLGTVSFDNAVPSAADSFRVVVLHRSGNFGPADQQKLVDILGANKAVILLDSAPRKLATGDLTDPDVSSIAAGFGGATSLEYWALGSIRVRSSNPAGSRVQLPAEVLGMAVPNGAGNNDQSAYVLSIDGTGEALITTNGGVLAFVAQPTLGGRVFYQYNLRARETNALDATLATVFRTGAAWALGSN